MFRNFFVLFLLTITLAGCAKNSPVTPAQELPAQTAGVFVLNEGGFGKSNSTLSFYVPDSNKVYPDIFSSVNNRSLGDVGNDMVIYGNKGYIVVNNSNKIEVIALDTYKSLGTMAVAGNSPCKLAIVNDSKGYITNLYKGTVTSFNPTTYSVINDGIQVGENPQGIATANGKVYVCNSGYGSDSTVSVIDPGTDSVVATIEVEKQPTDIAVDSDGNLVVMCYGYVDYNNSANDTPGEVAVISPKTNSVVATIPLPLSTYGHPSELAVSTHGYGFTFVQNGVLKFDTKTGCGHLRCFYSKNGICYRS